MKRLTRLLAVAATGLTLVHAQDEDGAPLLRELMQNIEYATLLQKVGMSLDQLSALAELQERWQGAAVAPPDVADALDGVCAAIAGGKPPHEAHRAVGEFQQEIQKTQRQVREAEESLITELTELLTAEQHKVLVAFHSPARHLAGLVQWLKHVRRAPEAWPQFRSQAVQGLMRFASQPGGTKVTVEELGKWLDIVREMSDEEFAEAEPTLAQEWAEALAPETMKRVNLPQNRERRFRESCNRLLTHPSGRGIVRRILEAAAEGTD